MGVYISRTCFHDEMLVILLCDLYSNIEYTRINKSFVCVLKNHKWRQMQAIRENWKLYLIRITDQSHI